MNDDRFGRDIAAALLKDDPGAVPAGLRGRVASVPDETGRGRAAGSPGSSSMTRTVRMIEAIAAVVVVGALVAGTLILRGSSVGLVPDGSGSPSPTSSSGPSLPNPTVLITPTAAPSKSPSPSAAAHWTGLSWSAPSAIPNASTIDAIIAWKGEYFAAGRAGLVNSSGGQISVGIWRSTDGITWTQVGLKAPLFDNAHIAGLVGTPSGLVAVGTMGDPVCTGEGEGMTCGPIPVMIWTSPNGTDWSRVADLTMFKDATIQSIAFGLLGLVAVGDTGFNEPAIWVSATGSTWQRTALPADVFADAHLSGISATATGFVMGGSIGGTPPAPGGVQLAPTGVAAAWWFDGRNWHKATVNRTGGLGNDLGGISVGEKGMVAIGSHGPGKGGGVVGWTSLDGHVWQPIAVGGNFAGAPTARPGVPMLPAYTIGGDGTHLVAMGSDPTGLHVWISSDGFAWQETSFLGATGAISLSIDDFVIVPDGLLAFVAFGGNSSTDMPVWMVTAQQ